MKKRLERVLFVCTLVMIVFPLAGNAAPIATCTFDIPDQWAYSPQADSFELTLGFGPDIDSYDFNRPWTAESSWQGFHGLCSAFCRVTISPDAVGRTFDMNFPFGLENSYHDLAYTLTDGNREMLLYRLRATGGDWDSSCGWVSWEFAPEYRGNGIDFQGYLIDNLQFTLNDFQYDPYASQDWGNVRALSGTVTVHVAPVPEPASMLLLGAGLIGAAGLGKHLGNRAKRTDREPGVE